MHDFAYIRIVTVIYYLTAGTACRPRPLRSDQLLFVDNQLELQSELFRRLAAEDHTLQKDLKVIHYRADPRVNLEFQLDNGLFHPSPFPSSFSDEALRLVLFKEFLVLRPGMS